MGLLYQAMANMARDFDENRVAAGFVFGMVKSEEPIEIEIDDKIVLSERFLAIAEHLSDYDIGYEFIKPGDAKRDDAKENTISEIKTTSGFYVEHEGKRDVKVESAQGEIGEFVGEGTIKLLNHLRIGDKVILMRMNGGHQYIVVDRISETEKGEL